MYVGDVEIGDLVTFENDYLSEIGIDMNFNVGDSYRVDDVDVWGEDHEFDILIEFEYEGEVYSEWIDSGNFRLETSTVLTPVEEKAYTAWEE